MTAREILTDLARLGITLAADGGRLRYHPREKLTPELLAQLREAKAELLRLLVPEAPPTDWPDPSPKDLAAARLTLDAFDPPARSTQSPPAGQCRCGCPTWLDIAIHNGQSARRDCGRCGRFVGFPLWHGQRFDV